MCNVHASFHTFTSDHTYSRTQLEKSLRFFVLCLHQLIRDNLFKKSWQQWSLVGTKGVGRKIFRGGGGKRPKNSKKTPTKNSTFKTLCTIFVLCMKIRRGARAPSLSTPMVGTLHLLENTFDRKRNSANPSPNPNPNSNHNFIKHNQVFERTK